MKKIIFALAMMLLSSSGWAASEQYTNAMKGLLQKMGDAKSPEAYQAAANGFERIANNEKSEWLPAYYASFCYIMQAMSIQDKDKVDGIVDHAETLLETASTIQSNDEILCLQSLCKSARINVNPMARGMKYGPQAAELIAKAKTMNPNNPRVYYLEGQSKFYTPEAFGGGKDKAKVLFEKAVETYAAFKPSNELMPVWGAEQAKEMLEACYK